MSRTSALRKRDYLDRVVRAVQAGADITEEPIDQPYGVREYGARDLEGQLWYIHSALE